MTDLNWLAILTAAAGSFLLGGPWYSPLLFGRAWAREANDTRPPGSGHPAKVFGLSFAFAVVAAAGLAYWLGPNPPLGRAVGHGLLAGGCFVAPSFGVNYQFANRGLLMWAIDAGYHVAQFTLFGVVLGLWH